MHRPEILKEILDLSQSLTERGESLVAVFDLDSTLFEVEHRLLRIISEFSQDETHQALYPHACGVLKKQDQVPRTHHFSDFLKKLGLSNESESFKKAIFDFWKDRFFTSPYLVFDRPYAGAQKYVESLWNTGAQIIYLTGRDIPRMLEGTEKSLLDHGFIFHRDRVELVLKPHQDLDDMEFKVEYFSHLELRSKHLWLFENEPYNIKHITDRYPQVRVVFFDSAHSEKVPAPGARSATSIRNWIHR